MSATGFPYEVDCPSCHATAGHWCKRPSGHSGPMVAPHALRRLKATAEAGGPITEQLYGKQDVVGFFEKAAASLETVTKPDLFGNVHDTFQTEAELNGFSPSQGPLL